MKVYVFKTTDFGKTWKSIATDAIKGYAHVVREDLVKPDLLFVGTEFGLFVSINGGAQWAQFTGNLPPVAVRDLVIHPREHDLVLATHGRGILIIDDNRDATDSLHALLRDHGFSCASALDGPSGLQSFETFAPDVVLLDIGLPGLDGYAVARRIRSSTDGNRCLIVALTGYGQERDRERSAQAGIDAHLVKPVELDQLLAVIRTTSSFEPKSPRSAPSTSGRAGLDRATSTS